MSALGELPPIDVTLNADLGWERQATYDIIAWYTPWLASGVKVEVVDTGDIRGRASASTSHSGPRAVARCSASAPPTSRFCLSAGGSAVRGLPTLTLAGTGSRSVRTLLPYLEQVHRMSTSEVEFVKHVYPLVDLGMTRTDCVDWLKANNLPVPPKSACVGCPYRQASEWLELKDQRLNLSKPLRLTKPTGTTRCKRAATQPPTSFISKSDPVPRSQPTRRSGQRAHAQTNPHVRSM